MDTLTREEAAALVGCSTRTIDRRIPPGTPGRTGPGRQGEVVGTAEVRISRKLVEALMPAPGGDLVAER